MKKRIFAGLLCVCLLVGLLPTAAFAAGTDTGKAIQLGIGGISGWDSTDGYDYIYFGDWTISNKYTTYGPIKWRVLDDQTNTEGDGLFLLSDALYTTWLGVTFQKSYHSVTISGTYAHHHKGEEPSDGDHTDCLMMNAWQGSDAQKWCSDFYSGYLTTQEQNAVLATTKSDKEFTITITNAISTYQRKFYASENILNKDKVFFLSVEEAKNENYGFTNDDARIANYDDTALWYNFWWLRSPSASATGYAGIVDYDGSVNTNTVKFARAARPAFNLDPNSVLFISAAAGGKADTAGDDNLTAVGTGTGEWKLTLKDTDRRSFSADVNGQTSVSASAGGSVQITYSGAQTGTNEYVSAMIADDSGTILYYGRVAQNSANGTASVTIPSGLAAGSYTLKVFSEQYNGDYQTDYASDFVDISLSVTGSTTPPDPPDPDTTAPNLTAGDATRTSEANATVKFISDEAGTYYYAIVDSGTEAPSDLTTSGSCVSGNNTIDLTTLVGAGAKDIYIIVKDAAENESDQLQITIPAYTAPRHGISASPKERNFGNLSEGYTAPPAQTITITNTGQSLVTLTPPTATYFEIGTLSKADLSVGEAATFTVQPKTGYTKGTYSETITVTGSLHPLNISGGGIEPWKPGGDTGGSAELTSMTYRAANAITSNGQTENTITASVSVSFTVNAPLSTDAGVTAVSVDGVAGTISGTTITVELPHNTALPTDSSKITITTADGASTTTPTTSDNGATWTFTVTAEDGSTQKTYTINVSVNGTHTYGDWQSDGQSHWKECACGDKTDVAAHIAGDWITDTAATETTDGTKHKECTVCGYVLETGTIPATGTSHTHSYDGSWKFDADNHWRECSCGEKTDVANHAYDGEQDTTCNVCGHVRTVTPTSHSVTVQTEGGGTASASPTSATAGTTINLTATANSGHHFKEWVVVSGGVTISGNSFTMPYENVTVKAVFEQDSTPPQPTTYTVTINGGGAGASGNGSYPRGATVNIYAGTRSGYTFTGWSTGDVTIQNADSVNASFTMPDKAVTVTANWKKNSGGGSSGGGFGSSGGGVSTYTVAVEDAAHGSVKADRTRAASGTTVTITVTPDDGYELDALTVTDSRGNELKLTDKGNGKYSFKMPTSKVTVEASFAKSSTAHICPSLAFTDLSTTAWYHEAVDFVLTNGMMSGYGGGSFGPNSTLSRAQLCQILYNLEGKPAVGPSSFTDVAADAWCSDAVAWANANGIVGGYGDGRFGPNAPITREQLAAILWRYARFKGYDVSIGEDTNILSYADAFAVSEYAIPAMQWACGAGVAGGYEDHTLRPQNTATRAQVAQMLMNFLKNI